MRKQTPTVPCFARCGRSARVLPNGKQSAVCDNPECADKLLVSVTEGIINAHAYGFVSTKKTAENIRWSVQARGLLKEPDARDQ